MAVPDTRDTLEAAGYQYTGSSICRQCGKDIEWFTTPKGKRMGMSVIPSYEDADPQRLEFHKHD